MIVFNILEEVCDNIPLRFKTIKAFDATKINFMN